ncbi:MAG: energy-coupling factor transporter ATPase [Oscillospiraceae bacterium]|nr:energy-coupling factor transporter ATPase [Oscillospiraceae bacterium]
MRDIILQTENLIHTYSPGTPFEHKGVDGISFVVHEGETVGLIGQTGSGKSTLIQHLNGLLKPTSGRILYRGEDIFRTKTSTRETRFHVGLVFQYPEYQLFEETVEKDIAFGPKNMGLSQEEIAARVARAAAFVDIDDEMLQKSPFELSGGQKRRAAIAGIIAMEPDVLILDEPTAGLDPAGRESLMANIMRYKEEKGAAVVIVSHSMDEVARIADRIVVLSGGKVAMEGTPAEIFSRRQELEDLAMSVPEVTNVFAELDKLGISVPGSVYTMEQAVEAILSLKGGGAGA